ncbi:receptor-like protein 9DC3 [Rhododendron vialii]|uniref:receptor-like protein 9DC3 n=1 Tax=Rhododendron vialii TaxID=182163 RepID=UPI00265F7F66|nr:receptor-like protein 9DC3 [Rhododendron vialii]
MDLQTLENVEYLDLSNTNLSVVARSNVNNTLPNLRNIYLLSCNIKVFPNFLRALENLEKLDLFDSRIQFVDRFQSGLGSSGRVLVMRSNRFHGPINTMMSEFSFPRVLILDLSGNGFIGHLPGSDNKGERDCILENFDYLKNNRPFVQQFLLTDSNAQIPNAVEKLDPLVGLQFDTFDNSSYTGNVGLCGLPLSKKCEDNRTKVQPPVLQGEDDSDFDGFTWKIVVIGITPWAIIESHLCTVSMTQMLEIYMHDSKTEISLVVSLATLWLQGRVT